MKKGMFYGVSVGPGDPEHMTLKAVRILRQCQVIAAPATIKGRMLALEIASANVNMAEKTVLPLRLSMTKEPEQRRAEYRAAAEAVATYLEAGADVAMVNLGDVSIYATCPYLMELLRERGYETVLISGVPSFCAAAGELGVSLTEGNQPIHIISGQEELGEALSLPGTRVLMKSGRHLPEVLQALGERALLDKAMLIKNCGLPDQALYADLSAYESDGSEGYFTLVIVKG